MEDFVGVEVRDANGAFYKVIIFFPTAYNSRIFISVMSKCICLHKTLRFCYVIIVWLSVESGANTVSPIVSVS